jgi:hypothetical protein
MPFWIFYKTLMVCTLTPVLLSFPLAASLTYVFHESTIAGRIILFTLFLGSIFSWSVIFFKLRHLQVAKRQNAHFFALFYKERAPLRIYESAVNFGDSPLFEVYEAGCTELCFQLLGATEVDEKKNFSCADACGNCGNGTGCGRISLKVRITYDCPFDSR